MKIIVVGGGAAGFFSALAAKELNPKAEVLLLEGSLKLLSKVRISGGGRSNVTHGCFDPKQLVQNYPRGEKELLGPFHVFQPKDTIRWFKKRGVLLKQEKDGRIFPVSNSSETIIQCFLKEAEKLGVEIYTKTKVRSIQKIESRFSLDIGKGSNLLADRLILATGSAPIGWELAKGLAHTIQSPVPSLFTFNIPSFPLASLSGVSVDVATLQLKQSKLKTTGPLLITHWGFSGPVALKLSALAARILAEKKYRTSLSIDWLANVSKDELESVIKKEQLAYPLRRLENVKLCSLPKRLLKELYKRSDLSISLPLKDLSKKKIAKLCDVLKHDCYEICGKTTNKEEFVTCGGITLSEVNFKTMESKSCEHLFFCGEILDIDGITGGFNFQNAWTTGWIAGRAAVS